VTFEDLGNLGEIIAAVATVATLAYLGIQIRENTRALRVQSIRDQSTAAHGITSILGSNKQVASVFQRGLGGSNNLDAEEQTQFVSLMSIPVISFQAAFNEYKLGLTSKEMLDTNASVLRLLQTPGGEQYWKDFAFTFTPEFRDYVDNACQKLTN